jgi:hypothetical protein
LRRKIELIGRPRRKSIVPSLRGAADARDAATVTIAPRSAPRTTTASSWGRLPTAATKLAPRSTRERLMILNCGRSKVMEMIR